MVRGESPGRPQRPPTSCRPGPGDNWRARQRRVDGHAPHGSSQLNGQGNGWPLTIRQRLACAGIEGYQRSVLDSHSLLDGRRRRCRRDHLHVPPARSAVGSSSMKPSRRLPAGPEATSVSIFIPSVRPSIGAHAEIKVMVRRAASRKAPGDGPQHRARVAGRSRPASPWPPGSPIGGRQLQSGLAVRYVSGLFCGGIGNRPCSLPTERPRELAPVRSASASCCGILFQNHYPRPDSEEHPIASFKGCLPRPSLR